MTYYEAKERPHGLDHPSSKPGKSAVGQSSCVVWMIASRRFQALHMLLQHGVTHHQCLIRIVTEALQAVGIECRQVGTVRHRQGFLDEHRFSRRASRY